MTVVSVSHVTELAVCAAPAPLCVPPLPLVCVLICRQLEVCGTLLGSVFSLCLSPLFSRSFSNIVFFALHVLTGYHSVLALLLCPNHNTFSPPLPISPMSPTPVPSSKSLALKERCSGQPQTHTNTQEQTLFEKHLFTNCSGLKLERED